MYLGIDGGGSKTRIALTDHSGEIIADFVGGPSNPLSVSMDTIKNTFDDLLLQIEAIADLSEIVSVCAGIAGLENSHAKAELDTYLKRKFSEHTNVEICHDALTALYSGTNGDPGIVNIAGTGSITFGLTDELQMVRSGGWGYLLDHTGSGYGIGRAALQKVFDLYDRSIINTALTERILTKFKVSQPPELIPYIYSHPDSRTNIASICEEVFQLMREGDGYSMQIIEKAAFDISKGIRNLIERHFKNLSEIKVVLTGSVFRSCDLILPMLERHVPGEVEFILPKSPPVAGSIIQSYQSVNGKCPIEFTRNLHASLKEG